MACNDRKQSDPYVLDSREARGMVDSWQEYLCLASNPEGGFKLFVGGYPPRSRKMREDENFETLLFTENDDEAVGRWLETTGWASQRTVASVKAELTKITSARSSLQLPTNWRNWPTDIEVLFQYTETNSVAADDYLVFAVNDLTQAAEKLFSVEKDHWYFPGYRLHSVGVVAAISVWVDWPLSRKSGAPQIQERDGPRRDALGLTYGAEDTLLYLWKRPNGPMGYSSQLRLSTGGRTLADAIEAYDVLAPQLRRLRLQFLSRQNGAA